MVYSRCCRLFGYGVGHLVFLYTAGNQCAFNYIVNILAGHKLNIIAHLAVNLINIGNVCLGDKHSFNAAGVSRHSLFLKTADCEHSSADGNLTRHSNIAAHLTARKSRYKCGGDGNTCRGSILRNGGFGGVDMYIRLFIEFFVNTLF